MGDLQHEVGTKELQQQVRGAILCASARLGVALDTGSVGHELGELEYT